MGIERESRSIELVDVIEKTWGISRALQLIHEHGHDKVRSVHDRLIERPSLGKLAGIRSLSGYFVESLRCEITTTTAPTERYVESRNDEFIEHYLARQRNRGQTL